MSFISADPNDTSVEMKEGSAQTNKFEEVLEEGLHGVK